MKVFQVLTTLSTFIGCLLSGPVANRTSTADPSLSEEWNADVVETLGTLKEVLVKFERKWDGESIDDIVHKKQENTEPQIGETEVNDFAPPPRASERSGGGQQPTPSSTDEIRIIGDKMLGCPHSWPFHDEYPVSDPVCAVDSDCQNGLLCCQLFHSFHCLTPIEATPKPGECRFTEFNALATLHCLVDDPGCKYDSECSDPSWKCCKGPCNYNECLPSTVSPTPSEMQQHQSDHSPVPVTEKVEIPDTTPEPRTSEQTTRRRNTRPRDTTTRQTTTPAATQAETSTLPPNTPPHRAVSQDGFINLADQVDNPPQRQSSQPQQSQHTNRPRQLQREAEQTGNVALQQGSPLGSGNTQMEQILDPVQNPLTNRAEDFWNRSLGPNSNPMRSPEDIMSAIDSPMLPLQNQDTTANDDDFMSFFSFRFGDMNNPFR